MSPGLRHTSVPSGILIHPAVWPQHAAAASRASFRTIWSGAHLTAVVSDRSDSVRRLCRLRWGHIAGRPATLRHIVTVAFLRRVEIFLLTYLLILGSSAGLRVWPTHCSCSIPLRSSALWLCME